MVTFSLCAKGARNVRKTTVEMNKVLASKERLESFLRGPEESISFLNELAAAPHVAETVGGVQAFSVGKDQDEDSEGNFGDDGDELQGKERSYADKMSDKLFLSQGGCFLEIPIQEEMTTKITNEGLRANQGIHSRENENGSVTFEKTFTGNKQWIEGDEELHQLLPDKVKNEDLKVNFTNQDETSQFDSQSSLTVLEMHPLESHFHHRGRTSRML
uniref:Uncharacterized protein n=1 Tax=Sphaerodactylus townsendi TaxID=933632 RepID=A0ACB8EEQ6_9SAUR